ncbi:hypothetical protein NQ317_015629 [Molorchus minor]|uniref:Uncharacterized protein n=1 Tax=Molorchus minor TaxID=1323400 RepID=A0ABQ9JVK0_9CUCU|nr:hypothetical protein NQ317_015629 [Molorchus minor]
MCAEINGLMGRSRKVYEFSKVGGNDIYDFVKRILSFLITYNLAMRFIGNDMVRHERKAGLP